MVDRLGGWIRQQTFWLRLACFLGGVLALGFPALILSEWPLFGKVSDTLAIIILYVALLVVIRWWGRAVRRQCKAFRFWGLTGTRGFYADLGWGNGLAIASLSVLFAFETATGWIEWQSVSAGDMWAAGSYAVLLGFGVALVEELLFRGWLLRELYLDYGLAWAAAGSSAVYALVHAWGAQLPGLFVLGLVLVRARWLRGKLGLAIGLHAGWVAGFTTVNSLNWIVYAEGAPKWLVGFDGNPLAGLLGITCLGMTGMLLSALPSGDRHHAKSLK